MWVRVGVLGALALLSGALALAEPASADGPIPWYGRQSAIADSEHLCPPGSRRVHLGGSPTSAGMEDICLAPDASGNPIQEGPTLRIRDVEPVPSLSPGAVGRSARLVWVEDFLSYHLGRREGLHQHWFAPDQMELEEHYHDDSLDGAASTWYRNGQPRWQALFAGGRLQSADGDLTVLGQPCPQGALPFTALDLSSEACEIAGIFRGAMEPSWSGTPMGRSASAASTPTTPG